MNTKLYSENLNGGNHLEDEGLAGRILKLTGDTRPEGVNWIQQQRSMTESDLGSRRVENFLVSRVPSHQLCKEDHVPWS
jgi:hypothetical protein